MSSKGRDLIRLQAELREDIEEKEARFNYWVSRIMMYGLLIIPLVPASLTYKSIATLFPDLLHIPHWMAHIIGLITGFAIEFLGLLTLRTAMRMSKYNQKARSVGLHTAPAWHGWVAAGCYVGIVLSVVVFLKMIPDLIMWALIPMSLMAAIAEWGFLLNAEQTERELEMRQMEIDASEQEEIDNLRSSVTKKDLYIDRMNMVVQSVLDSLVSIQCTLAEHESVLTSLNKQSQLVQAEIADIKAIHQQSEDSLSAIEQELKSVQSRIVVQQNSHSEPTVRKLTERTVDEQKLTKPERQDRLLFILADEFDGKPSDDLNKSELGKRLSASHVTIGRDIDDLVEQGKLSINGHIRVLP